MNSIWSHPIGLAKEDQRKLGKTWKKCENWPNFDCKLSRLILVGLCTWKNSLDWPRIAGHTWLWWPSFRPVPWEGTREWSSAGGDSRRGTRWARPGAEDRVWGRRGRAAIHSDLPAIQFHFPPSFQFHRHHAPNDGHIEVSLRIKDMFFYVYISTASNCSDKNNSDFRKYSTTSN